MAGGNDAEARAHLRHAFEWAIQQGGRPVERRVLLGAAARLVELLFRAGVRAPVPPGYLPVDYGKD